MLPEGWTKEPIGDRVSIKHGFAFASSHFNLSGVGYRLLTPGHFAEEGGFRDIGHKQKYYSSSVPNGYLLKKDDLLVAMTEQAPGLLGSSLMVPEDDVYLHNQRLGLVQIRDFQTTSREYLFHLFNVGYVRKQISDAAAGTKVRHTSPDKIGSVPVFFPPKPQQEKIGAILDSWNVGIRNLTDLIAAKVRFKQGLMQQLLTGQRRFTGFRDEWKRVRLGELVSVRKEARTPSDECPLYSLTIEDGITPKSERYDRLALVRDKGNKTYKVVRPMDIVFNPSNLRWGAIGISRESHDVVVSPIYEVVYVSDESIVDPTLLFQALSAPHQIARFATMCEGTLVERMAVKLPTFLNCQIPFPSILAEQKRIAEALGVADRDVCLLHQQLEALKHQKKGLMQKLLTGQIRVLNQEVTS